MTTVVCDGAKIPLLLEKCDKCPHLKNIIKIGPVSEEEKAKGQECGIKIVAFSELQVMVYDYLSMIMKETKLFEPIKATFYPNYSRRTNFIVCSYL